MPLTLEQRWILASSALIAHADDVMDGAEIDRLMAMIEDEADADEYAKWMTAIGDAQAVRSLVSQLELPPEAARRTILEEAWTMAAVDGTRCQSEVEALRAIGERLGIESVQLDFWREAWTQQQDQLAEQLARLLSVILGGETAMPGDWLGRAQRFLDELPTTDEQRERVQQLVATPQSLDDVVRQLGAIRRGRRQWLLRAVADGTRGMLDGGARTRFLATARALGVESARAKAMLETRS